MCFLFFLPLAEFTYDFPVSIVLWAALIELSTVLATVSIILNSLFNIMLVYYENIDIYLFIC